jgi:hypothetical protein
MPFTRTTKEQVTRTVQIDVPADVLLECALFHVASESCRHITAGAERDTAIELHRSMIRDQGGWTLHIENDWTGATAGRAWLRRIEILPETVVVQDDAE